MADVIGYEEKDQRVLSKFGSGYPRFVVHPYLRKIEAHWQSLFDTPQKRYWPVSSDKMAQRLQEHLGGVDAKFIRHRGVSGLRLPPDDATNRAAKDFLQHIGGFLSSRQAEDYLVAEGTAASAYPENGFEGDASKEVRRILAPLLGSPSEDIVLANTGMNAFFAVFEAVKGIQSPKGRNSWVKLGWLYSDTMHILDKLSGTDAENIELLDVFDLDRLEKVLEQRGESFAGIVTEAPTNPLVQTIDLERIRKLATKYEIFLIVDPTVSSPANIDVTPYADLIVNSLTKYAASEGDVMLGAIAATAQCPEREALIATIRSAVEPAYSRDLSRLASQVSRYGDLVEQTNRNAAKVAAFLETHPKVRKTYWAKEPSSRANFKRIARHADAVGALMSFEYDGPLAEFYDRVALPKGPSFGMTTSLLCPYIYLAHYALATSEDGRGYLAQAGISPELLRLSVGTEPAEEIIAALDAALSP